MQRIVFVGNCQVQAIYNLYQRFAWHRAEQALTYVPSYEEVDDAAASEIAKADIIVEQVFDMAPKAQIEGLNPQARRVLVPLVGCNFLWPFAGSARIHNPARPFLPMGVFPAEFGISFLDRMIRDGSDPERAVEAFMTFDVPARINLDRLYELSQDRQRRRDALTDFGFADLIERYFRDERLFLSVYHPDRRIALELAAIAFDRMGVPARDIARMQRAIRRTPFPPGELPIHPAVVRHFGLRYLPAEPRFAFLNEGRLTFRDIALRYMRCEWNETLEEGIERVKQGDYDGGEKLLRAALHRSPDSAAGHAYHGRALHHSGRPGEAIAALRRAVQLDEHDQRAWSDLAGALQAIGDLGASEAAFRRAIEIDPWDDHNIALLAHLLHANGRIDDAAAVIAEGLRTDDRSAKLHLEMAFLHEARQDWESAVRSYRTALSLDPALPAAAGLARAIAQTGKGEQGVMAGLVDQARALRNAGSLAQAAELLGYVAAQAPGDIETLLLLGDIQAQAGRLAEAAAAFQDACERHPDHPRPWLRLGEMRLEQGDPFAAEPALRRALALDDQGHCCFLLMISLERQGRYQEAIQIGQHMVALDADSPHRHLQLALVGMRAGTPSGTEASLLRAFALAPEEPRFLIELSDALMHAGFEDQAVRAARAPVRLAPDNNGFRENLVLKLAETGDLTEAQSLAGLAPLPPPAPADASSPECSGPHQGSCDIVVFDGDSISAGTGASGGHGLDSGFMRALAAPARVYNVAGAGRPVVECLLRFSQAAAPLYNARARLNLVVFHAGDNDINMGRTAVRTYKAFARYVALARAQGWKVVVSTELPRPDFSPARAKELDAYNRLLRQNDAGADAVVDFTIDPRLGDAGQRAGSVLFADDLHPNDAGYAVLGQQLAAAVQPLLERPAVAAQVEPADG